MTGLIPVIHVVQPPDTRETIERRRRVDGRDKPGHDGGRGVKAAAHVPDAAFYFIGQSTTYGSA